MKYEAVFGNQELFDGAGTFTGLDVVVHSIASGIKSYARLSDLTPESLRNHPVCAMRRIIKEPNRWTWEDKKAGRLPEVGAECNHCHSTAIKSVIAVTDEYVGIKSGDRDNNPYFITHAEFFTYYIPIETPAEKAQREEDEFVNGESFFVDVCTMSGQMKAAYTQGLRAAYRKLKGGE
jgi:hypothetical protein